MYGTKTCKWCGLTKEYEKQQHFAIHVSHCKMNPTAVANMERFKQNAKKKRVQVLEFNLNCKKCGNPFTVKMTQSKFDTEGPSHCSRSCANSRIHSDETRLKTANSLRKRNRSESVNIIGAKKIVNYDPLTFKNGRGRLKHGLTQICQTKQIIPRKIKYSTVTGEKIKYGCNGGPRPGGGYSKMIEFTSNSGEVMKLNNDEIRLAKILDILKLDWSRNWIGFPYLDLKNRNRNYYPDFYIKEYDLYVEYKGFVTDDMQHKMNDAQLKNDFKLLIVYSDNKRYKNLGLNIEQLENDPNVIWNHIEG